MRIMYVIPGPMGRSPEGKAEVQRRGSLLRQWAAPGAEVDIIDVPRGPASIESMYEEYLSIPAAVEKMMEVESQGYAAAILGCYGDPGLDAMREMVAMPVVGPGEAGFHAAAQLGYRFSIITITESIINSMRRLVENAGLGGRLASVRVVDTPVLMLAHDRAETVRRVVEQGRKCIGADGADTLILGCMSMGFLEIAEEASEVLGVPVINPARIALKTAEALVGAGLTHSKRAFMTPPKVEAGLVGKGSLLFETLT
jgi:allantoin racemase